MSNPDFQTLPEPVRLEETVSGVDPDPDPVQAPEVDRNNDQWNALNDGG